jgi:peptidoglycan lytic transglycosylase
VAMNLLTRTMMILAACTMAVPAVAKEKVEKGIASWYGYAEEGRLTASGQTMDHQRLTAAHRSLPFGSVVEVINQKNGRSVEVTINDRGPFEPGRIIDLSPVAASVLGMKKKGVAPVTVKLVKFE